MAASLVDLQQRGKDLFTRLLDSETMGERAAAPPTERRFSWFHPPDALAATTLALRFSALAASASDLESGLEAVLDAAEDEPPARGLLRQALSIFVTHDVRGRHLVKPRTVSGAPALFTPSTAPSQFEISEGGASPELDYWREDPLANEHHEHWHQVYPFQGVPVRDFQRWVAETPTAVMAQILEARAPGQDWRAQLEAATPETIATFFEQFVADGHVAALPPALQRRFLVANDRHGELFVYMHAQMLARYDAELASHGLDPVEPWAPSEWRRPIPSGHNPIEVAGFGRRPPNSTILDAWADLLDGLQAPIEDALASGVAVAADGASVSLDPVRLGEMIEAVAPWTTDLDTDVETGTYRGLHNTGHGILGALAPGNGGVMNNPVVAIRDPVFWRWHKHIDDLAAAWHDTRPPTDFTDGPPVRLRASLNGTASPWESPDIILVDPGALPPGRDPGAIGSATFGGANWDTAPGDATGEAAAAVIDGLRTRMDVWDSPIGPITFLTHAPFIYYLRIHNDGTDEDAVTVRIFIAPASTADDRRAWIEMDKFRATLAPGENVVYRADTESAVIKRPAEAGPGEAGSGPSGGESAYCDCGWPYSLLLPRGTDDGMDFRMLVICTRWEDDLVAEPDACGSMSFCGAVDRYPDLREMGYPFARPFTDPIANVFAALAHAAGRTFTIRHVT